MSGDGNWLAERAAEVRMLSRCLEVRCPARGHEHALAGVACYPPSEEHPQGFVCIERHHAEVDSRNERDEKRQAIAKREREAQRAERRASNESRARARVTARIARAAGQEVRP
ncbi:hypothetical protein [Microbacterium sp. Root180]|uniref:hypothetical protein n=1 Tax=Microbacterium sp. Root180 TaxID=1736483 RepID=UPI0006FF6C9B|nr:hypothetical protein [Microbacterium sp. Root180]KRB38823.1 hypothetical protein ASD93_02465 [Microbacterium sp. Root180]